MSFSVATSNIVRMAMTQLELDPVSSVEDGDPKAADAAAFYPQALDEVLEGTDWSFASRVAHLPPVVSLTGTEPDPELPHVYQIPGDALMLRRVGSDCCRWRRDDTLLRASEPAPLPVRYTVRLQIEAAMPAAVRSVVALRLALLMAPRWVGDPAKVNMLRRQHDDQLTAARREDARQASSLAYAPPGADDWVWSATR